MTPPRRSWLFTPATRPERFARAGEIGADVLIVDLEDSVAPGDKAKAREAAQAFLAIGAAALVPGDPARALRINGLRTRDGLEDARLVAGGAASPDVVIVPKTETPAELELLDAWLTAADCSACLVALIESARGLDAVASIARAVPRLSALMFGAADLAADLGCALAWEPLLYARGRVVAAAASAGLDVLDAPWFDLQDQAGLEAELRASVALGFTGKAAIHPRHVTPINAALTPSPAQVSEAREIVRRNAAGVGVVDGRMIDEAIARRARRILAAVGDAG